MSRVHTPLAPLALLALAAGATFAPTAEAGIVVTKEGRVVVGRITKDDVLTGESVTLHWPYKENKTKGRATFAWHLIRWHDIEADEPTSAYWDRFANEPIDAAYIPQREIYLDRKKQHTTEVGKLILEDIARSGVKLTLLPLPFKQDASEIQVRKPEGWLRQEVEGILTLVSDQKGRDQIVPRIHIYSTPTPPTTATEQKDWIKAVLKGSIADSKDRYEERDEELKQVSKGGEVGAEYTITTTIKREGQRPITTLRHVFFKTNRVYFFSAHCHRDDYDKYSILFRAVLQSMQITDLPGTGSASVDLPGGPEKPSGETPPGGDRKP